MEARLLQWGDRYVRISDIMTLDYLTKKRRNWQKSQYAKFGHICHPTVLGTLNDGGGGIILDALSTSTRKARRI